MWQWLETMKNNPMVVMFGRNLGVQATFRCLVRAVLYRVMVFSKFLWHVACILIADSVIAADWKHPASSAHNLLCPLFLTSIPWLLGFSGGSVGKEFACSAVDTGDVGLIPGSGRSPGRGHGNPLHLLAWRIPWAGVQWPIVLGVSKSGTQLKRLSLHIPGFCLLLLLLPTAVMAFEGLPMGPGAFWVCACRNAWEFACTHGNL